jgi:hypothetical protein
VILQGSISFEDAFCQGVACSISNSCSDLVEENQSQHSFTSGFIMDS